MIESQKGFTLVELIVMIGIFGIITGVVVVNLRGGSPAREVQLQADNLASLMRQAQVQALGGEPFEGTVPVGGFGVNVAVCSSAPCSVTLFADADGDFTYDVGTEEIETLSFGRHVTIESISTGSPVDVVFKPPKPFICINRQCSGVDEVIITLGSEQTSREVSVVVNQISGQVSS